MRTITKFKKTDGVREKLSKAPRKFEPDAPGEPRLFVVTRECEDAITRGPSMPVDLGTSMSLVQAYNLDDLAAFLLPKGVPDFDHEDVNARKPANWELLIENQTEEYEDRFIIKELVMTKTGPALLALCAEVDNWEC